MTEPIPPLDAATISVGPRTVRGRIGVAFAMVCRDGFPYAAEAQREVFEQARSRINESFRRRHVPTPAGGWKLVLVHPEQRWEDYINPELAAHIRRERADAPVTAAVAVVLAVDITEGRR